MRMGLTTIEYERERERERDVAAGGIERHFSPPFGWQRVGSTKASTTNTITSIISGEKG